jgi:hypothetical protein
MVRATFFPRLALGFVFAVAAGAACNDDHGNSGQGATDGAGGSCEVAGDCYPDVDHATLAGEVMCMDQVEGGYCTHFCESDDQCCAVDGECETDFPQVCAPFENSTDKRCFLSCEDADVGDQDPDEFCQINAHADFGCRSTGGGSMNRKVCMPN